MQSAILDEKRPFCVFEPPLGVRGNVCGPYLSALEIRSLYIKRYINSPSLLFTLLYDVYLRLIGKRVVDFLLALIGFFARCYTAEVLRANMD